VRAVYYPELSEEMAMKIGDEYSSDRVTPRDFEKLAEQAGLAKPLVRRRVPELAEAVLAAIDSTKSEIAHPMAEAVAAVVRKRCEKVQDRFSK
jgi:serine/threonine-protein kinase HipA